MIIITLAEINLPVKCIELIISLLKPVLDPLDYTIHSYKKWL